MSNPSYNAICKRHGQPYTNYCMICYQPLCPNDIEQHFYIHKETNQIKIQTIKNTQTICFSKIDKIKEFVEREKEKLQSQDLSSNVEVLFQKIMNIKKSMISEVNKMIEAKVKDIQILEQQCRRIQIRKPVTQAAMIVNQYMDKLQNGHPEMIQTIRQVLLLDDHQFVKIFFNQINENIQKYKATRVQITYDQIRYRTILQDCFKVINPYPLPVKYKKNKDISFDMGQQLSLSGIKANENQESAIDQTNIFNKFLKGLDQKAKVQQDIIRSNNRDFTQGDSIRSDNQQRVQPKKIIIKPEELSKLQERLPINETEVQISIPPNQIKYLHFFEPQSNKLHIVKIPTLEKKITEVNFPFQIPIYHKSLQLANGTLILTGGKLTSNKKNRQVFMYSVDKKKLKEMCVVLPRSSHALCEHEGFLYILGGFGEKNIEREVEKLSFGEKVNVEYVKPSRFGGSCNAVSIGKYLVKLSPQGIQVYSSIQDNWKYLSLKDYLYFDNCLTSVLNPNQIFVFGGYDEGQRGVRNSFSIYMNSTISKLNDINSSTLRVCRFNKFPLPKGQGFSDNCWGIHKGKLYALQNQSDEFNECLDDEKSVLSFNGKVWEQSYTVNN